MSTLVDELPPFSVITDSLQTDSYWLLKEIAPDAYFVTFRHPHRGGLDLSASLFCASNGKFAAVSLDTLAASIEEAAPRELVLEHPDVLVSSGLCTAARALEWIAQVSAGRTCVVSVCVHAALESSQLPVHRAAAALAVGLLHRCHLQLDVQTLTTGHSSEYAGVVEAIPGPQASTAGGAGGRPRTFLYRFERDKVRLEQRI